MIISKLVIDKNTINSEVKVLNNILNQQRQLKKTLLLYLEKLSEGISNANDPTDSNSLITCLGGIKKSFDNIKDNMDRIIKLKNYLNAIIVANKFDEKYIEAYNSNFLELFDKITEDNIFYYTFFESLIKYMQIVFPESKTIVIPIKNQIDHNYVNTSHTITTSETTNIELPKENTNVKLETPSYLEQTLLISLKNKKIILPYTISELEKHFSNYPEKYSNLQDIIDKEYTISSKIFRNNAFSRFKETMNLAQKSGLSFINSLSLANELFFNTELNPAVIAACRNIDELDIYLSCLEDGQLDDFKCFKIQYI